MAVFRPTTHAGNLTLSEDLSTEQKIMVVMRKVLARIIKDTTPPPGMQHPLSEGTVEDIRQCLGLIAARERELGQILNPGVNEKPYYVDEVPAGKVVPISDLTKRNKK
ncbi:MAG: segregation and condensation protein A [Chromatiales bacterium]|nr:segregation and condensation protein A [Chromatiales bacterium]